MSHTSHIFPTKMTRKVVYYLRSNRIFMKRFVNGKQPVTTVPLLLEQRKRGQETMEKAMGFVWICDHSSFIGEFQYNRVANYVQTWHFQTA